jgi:hypothetical protein
MALIDRRPGTSIRIVVRDGEPEPQPDFTKIADSIAKQWAAEIKPTEVEPLDQLLEHLKGKWRQIAVDAARVAS